MFYRIESIAHGYKTTNVGVALEKRRVTIWTNSPFLKPGYDLACMTYKLPHHIVIVT